MKEAVMQKLATALALVVAFTLVPSIAAAQGSITGVVRDTSGAVLPGVTVEAASPVLIEKVRTAVSDGTGQYRIVDLRPGIYTVTFTLAGFSVVRREGIELTGDFTATVNADLRVGAVEDTITVTGESPIVDVQSAKRQQVLGSDVITAIPAARGYNALVVLVPGITGGATDVATTPSGNLFAIHGGRTNEGRVQVDGVNVGAAVNGGGVSGYITDIGNAQEVSFNTSGGLGEAELGGPLVNIVPRAGGNMVAGSFYLSAANDAMQGSNYTQELQDAGLRVPAEQLSVWDINGAVGGPIRRDRLWYFVNARDVGSANSVPGMWANRNAGDPRAWTYEPDQSRQARNDTDRRILGLRLTWQVSPRNKLNLFWDEQMQCSASAWSDDFEACRQPTEGWVQGGSATNAPETGTYTENIHRVQQVTWTSPVTNRVLAEFGFGTYLNRWGGKEQPGNPTRDLVRVTEQAGIIPGLTYRSVNWASNWLGAHTWRGSLSYVTGAHNMKFGYQGAFHVDDRWPFTNNQRLSYRFNNGVPNQLTLSAGHVLTHSRVRYAAFYAQEQWTRGRTTLQGAVRYDHAWSYFPEQQVGPERFVPVGFTFAKTDGVKYQDVTPRVGFVYDVFGSGRTSLKVNIGKYLEAATNNNGNFSATNPTSRIPMSTTRAWTDANRDFAADCDLLNPAAQDNRPVGGDFCGAFANSTFGTNVLTTNYDPAILRGWGIRPWDWQFGMSVQQEVFPRVAVEAGYYRRWFGNFTVVDNLITSPADYTRFSIPAPVDPRLPGGGGYEIAGLYDVNPDKFGLVSNIVTYAPNYGSQRQYWHGVDVNVTARLQGGLTVQGGTSTGRQVIDYCEIRQAIPEQTPVPAPGSLQVGPTNPYCRVVEPFQTQLKGLATYLIPRVDLQISGTFQSRPGVMLAANYNVPNAVVAPSLGRPLSGGAANVTVNVVTPGELYGDRVNQLDLRVAKVLRFGRTRSSIGVDVYNVLNSAAVLGYNQTYSPISTAWLTPTSVLSARFARISVQTDF
jgi:hypothetical protein